MEDKISILISEEDIGKRICEMGQTITRDYQGKSLCMIIVLKGSVVFATELAKRIDLPVYFEFMKAKSYGDETVSSGEVNITMDTEESIEGKDVIVVEDIIDTGNTLSKLMVELKKRNPASLRLCTLLDKPERRKREVPVDYIGFTVPDKFIVGYGLDYAQKYRNLPYIGVVEMKEE